MTALSPYFLKTSRVGFSLWSMEQQENAMTLWGDFEVTKLIGGPFSVKQQLERLEREIESYHNYQVQYWPIYLLESGEFIGCGGFRPYKDESPSNLLELGFHLRPQFWGQGFGKEIGEALISYAFSVLHVKSLFAGHNPLNGASQHLLLKLGFQFSHHEYYPPTGLNHPSYILHCANSS